MTTKTQYGQLYDTRETRHCHRTPIIFIPCTPSWVTRLQVALGLEVQQWHTVNPNEYVFHIHLVKIEQKLNQWNQWELLANPPQHKPRKVNPNLQNKVQIKEIQPQGKTISQVSCKEG